MAQVQAAYDSALLLADRDVVRLLAAVVLANQLDGPPVWLMLVASSSGGKSALLMTLDDLELIPGKPMTHFISDLTENTLASGFKSKDQETSLLKKLPYGGVLVFKDFTSLLTKRREGRDAIMGQLREVYDRKFDKSTGNGADTAWKGKLGALSGVTQAVHEYGTELSIMGDRFILFSMQQPDRLQATRFVMSIRTLDNSQEDRLESAKAHMHDYLRMAMQTIKNDAPLHMKKEDQEKLIHVADFVTQVRSGVVQDDRTGHVTFVPSAEMPIRLIDQLMSIGTALSHMRTVDGREPELEAEDIRILYRIAFDSIPLKRRWALHQLASYLQGVSTSGLAAKMGYETEVVKGWLAQLAALGIIRRVHSGHGADMWLLNEQYREIMVQYEKVNIIDDRLINPNASVDDQLVDEALFDDPLRADEFIGG
jgi:hypothetical protein